MPVKWSPLRVSQAMDIVEEHLDAAHVPLGLAREKALAALEIPDLPHYITSELRSLASNIAEIQLRPRSDIGRIRRDLPGDALAAEEARQELGEQTALV